MENFSGEKFWLPVTESMLNNRPQAEIQLFSTVIGYRWPLDKAYFDREYVENGKSMVRIASETGFARTTISGLLDRYGVVRRGVRPTNVPRGQVPYGFKVRKGKIAPHLLEQRIINDLSEMRIAGASYGTLVKWLNKNKVKTKNGAKYWDRPTIYKILNRLAAPNPLYVTQTTPEDAHKTS